MKETTLVHIIKDGCVLMLHRVSKKDDINHGKWIGVGGKFEKGETPEECMRREVREETGLRVDRYRYCGIVTFVYTRVLDVIGTSVTSVLSMPLVPVSFLGLNLMWIFLALGISIGAWGSIVSMRRFLDT